MKKNIALFIFLLIAGVSFGQEFTFQGLPWGSSIEQVIDKLGPPTRIMFGYLEYDNIKVSGYSASLSMLVQFSLGLRRADYQFNEFPTNLLALKAYYDIRSQLTVKYGNPSKARINNYPFDFWSNENFHVALLIYEQQILISYYPDKEWELFLAEYNVDLNSFDL